MEPSYGLDPGILNTGDFLFHGPMVAGQAPMVKAWCHCYNRPMEPWTLTPDPDEVGLRLDIVLARRFPAISRRTWKTAIEAGKVLVNLREAGPSLVLTPTMTVSSTVTPTAPETLILSPAQDLARVLDLLTPVISPVMSTKNQTSQLLYLNDFIAVNKPGGIPCHPNTSDSGDTLANALAALTPGFATAGPKPLEGGLLNRIDTGTSGLVLGASSPEAWAFWHEALGESDEAYHCKEYLAILEGNILDWPGTASGGWTTDWPIAHHHSKHDRGVAVGSSGAQEHRGQGRPARTRWEILEAGSRASLVKACLSKAQYHQIRVHAAAMGHPLIGDGVYWRFAAAQEKHAIAGDFSGVRHGLHAWKIRLETKNGTLSLCAPVPTDFRNAVLARGLRISW